MPLAALANDRDDGDSDWSLGLGLGVISQQQPYTDIDREEIAIPIVQYENKYFRLFGPTAEVKLPGFDIGRSQRLDFSVLARYSAGAGYEPGDAPILNGMEERKGAFWAGAKAVWSSDWVDVSAEWTADVSGDSDGQRFALGLERTWRIGERIRLTPRLGANWMDDKFVDYYYGVRDSEARVGRPSYVGTSGVSAEAGLQGVYMFNQRHSLVLDLEITSLASEIKDSPLVDRSTQNRVFLGYVYRFR